jgi:hypothetical protein
MWWDYQNLNRARTDKSGTKWNFRVWHEVFTAQRVQSVARIFFWNEKRDSTGVVLLGPEANQHVRDLHNLIEKLVSSPGLRAKHRRQLLFPLDRHYEKYGAFPEELAILETQQPHR